jgi:hypothetical protein
MSDGLHRCYKGAVDVGFSEWAADKADEYTLCRNVAVRALIAEYLLTEAANDGTLERIREHAGSTAMGINCTDIASAFLRNDQQD